MVKLLKKGHSLERFLHGSTMLENTGRKAHSSADGTGSGEENGAVAVAVAGAGGEKVLSRSQGSATYSCLEGGQQTGSAPPRSSDEASKSRIKDAGGHGPPSDIELMKERFAKLLLGEDMSGGGAGVSSALALSNAITNLAASVFGEQRRLEPMPADTKARWRKEVDWLLSVTDHIVELVPSKQDGTNMEIMTTQQRKDLHMNIPALRKLDAMLLEYLDNFRDQQEFWYVSKNADDSEKRNDDKWWLPTVRVPPEGLSEVTRKWLQYQKELVNQVLKAAMAINANVLMEMEIPDAYIDSLPKNGRSSLGEALYRSITDDSFDPEEFLASVDLSTEHKILDLKNRIEASVVIWKRKMNNKDGKSAWGSGVSMEKREQFEDRAETILLIFKHRFPGLPQSSLDISKIQFNKDVGHSILESYSRVLETLAFTVMSRIEDVLYSDSLVQDPNLANTNTKRRPALTDSETIKVRLDPKEEMEKLNKMEASSAMTLSDFMGWQLDSETKKNGGGGEEPLSSEAKMAKKPHHVVTDKISSYIDKLEHLGGLKSPKSRH